jgi:hypothetical protein
MSRCDLGHDVPPLERGELPAIHLDLERCLRSRLCARRFSSRSRICVADGSLEAGNSSSAAAASTNG